MAFIKKISTSFSDAELVQQYKQTSNLNVLGDLYSRYMELVYGVCLKYFTASDDAQDAVINIFEELTQKVKKYEIENFRAWLYQLSKNYCLMKIRSNKAKPLLVDEDIVHFAENSHLDDVLEKEMSLNLMEHCLEQLPKEQKLAVELFYLQQKCYKEIAETTAIDVSKVRSLIQNGRRNLKICMDKTLLQKAE